MAKKTEEVPVVEQVEPTAPVPAVVVEKRTSGLATAGIIVGAVVVAGALFGGGVLVGTHIPQATQSQFGPGGDRGGFQGGPNGTGGPGPAMPGQGNGQGNGQRDGQGQTDPQGN